MDAKILCRPDSDERGWAQAKIVQVDKNQLKLEFTELPPERDKCFDRWSYRIAEFESKTKETYAWKRANFDEALKVKEVDCNCEDEWFKSTVIKRGTREETRD